MRGEGGEGMGMGTGLGGYLGMWGCVIEMDVRWCRPVVSMGVVVCDVL